jgi:MerR family transcriptional regulator, light-induced transcriptional regulator
MIPVALFYVRTAAPTCAIGPVTVAAAIQSRARAVALSIVYPADDFDLVIELRKLRRLLPPEIAVITGGRAAKDYAPVLSEIGAVQLQHLSAFYPALDKLRKPPKRKMPYP